MSNQSKTGALVCFLHTTSARSRVAVGKCPTVVVCDIPVPVGGISTKHTGTGTMPIQKQGGMHTCVIIPTFLLTGMIAVHHRTHHDNDHFYCSQQALPSVMDTGTAM